MIEITDFQPLKTRGQQAKEINRQLRKIGVGKLLRLWEDSKDTDMLKGVRTLSVEPSVVDGKHCVVATINFNTMKVLTVE